MKGENKIVFERKWAMPNKYGIMFLYDNSPKRKVKSI